MPPVDLDRLRARITAAGAEAEAAEAEVQTLESRIAELERLAEDLHRRGKDARTVEAQLQELRFERDEVAARAEDARARQAELRRQLDALQDPATALGLLDTGVPIALLPVRLETRLVPRVGSSPDGAVDLLVRVYHDDLHRDSHEPELTAAERDWGQRFRLDTLAAADQGARLRAWEQLVGRFGPRRAAWIAAASVPLDDHGMPQAAVDTGRRDTAWTRPPQTSVLPDAWAVLGYRDGQRVITQWGAPIPETLPTGPSPAVQVPPQGDQALAIDEGMRWMVDFQAAVDSGMALRIQLDPQQAKGLDRLLVLGVKASLDTAGAEGASRLAGLLDAHHYVDGLALVPQGTPTNNSAAGPAGRSSAMPPAAETYAVERGPSLAADETRDGARLATALGVDASVFAHVAHADGHDQLDALHMNTLLWPATWGYFLDQMMADTFPDAAIRQGREHFIAHVRGRGPLPAVRVGAQPYGVLPVTSIGAWVPVAEENGPIDAPVMRLLSSLRQVWRRALSGVPRVGGSGDPDLDFVRLLGMDARSSSYTGRPLLGRDYLRNLWDYLGVGELDPWWQGQERLGDAILAALGLPWTPRIARSAFAPAAFPVSLPLVQKPPPAGIGPLEPNYIGWYVDSATMGQMSYRRVRSQGFPQADQPGRPNALLYKLLRHAFLLQYDTVARRILRRNQPAPPPDPDPTRHEPELVDVIGGTRTAWRMLNEPVADKAEPNVGAYLDKLYRQDASVAPDPDAADLDELRESLRYLAALAAQPDLATTAMLERLLTETLDLSAHRLDAWITSFATKRLGSMRAAGRHRQGMHLGGYGWVEGLVPAPAGTPADLPPDAGRPVVMSTTNAGYVHAPSIGHATAAAVLRSGYLSHTGAPRGKRLAVDLSSARVRRALELFDGVRTGQRLGALLGYRFERGLHEQHPGLELDRFIQPFRRLAPLTAGKLTPADDPVESGAADEAVDGLELLRRWQAYPTLIPFGTAGLPAEGTAEQAAVVTELNGLADAVDAMSDLATAESVYQTVQGNHVRAGAVLDAASRSQAPPQELEITQSARSGVAITHRVVVLVDPSTAGSSGWSTSTPRARAQPSLDAWVAQLLGPPDDVICSVSYEPDPPAHEVSLKQLGLSALDVIAMAPTSGDAQTSELEQRLRYHALTARPAGVPGSAEVRLDFRRPPTRPNEKSVADFLQLVRAVQELMTGARPLDRRDLAPIDPTIDAGVVPTGLNGRVHDALNDLDAAAAKLATVGPTLADDLLAAAAFGVQDAVPRSLNPQALTDQAKSVAAELERRKTAARGADDAATALREIFGPGFPVLPPFTLSVDAPASDLGASFARSQALQGNDPLAALRWFQRAARVRRGLARLGAAFLDAEALGTGAALTLTVGQLPQRPDDLWVALPDATGARPPGGRVSIVAHLPSRLDLGHNLAGLLIDEWVEVVPSARETTAVTFHYDAPGAEAPQAILLAVPPDPATAWTFETLEAVVSDTLELAKLRSVDPDSLGQVGQFLPALCFAFNTHDDAITTNFTG